MTGLTGKTALVTGGSRGIGKAIAARLAAAGARVMISSRREENLQEAAQEMPGVEWFRANAGEPGDAEACIDACLRRFDGLDVLVNNAATNPYAGRLIDIDMPRAEKIARVNLLGPLLWTQLAWTKAMQSSGGTVLNIASTGAFVVDKEAGFYNSTKAGLVHLTRHLACELAPTVRVNAIAPGLIRTNMSRALWEGHEHEWERMLPLGRIGKPSDVAELAVFLASDVAAWITGQTFVVDGGETVRNAGIE